MRADIVVGMPSFNGSYAYEMSVSLEHMLAFTQKKGYDIIMHRTVGSSLSINRNNSVYKAFEMGAKWVLWVDSDMVMLPEYLLKLMERDVDIVSGLYFGKQPRFVPIAARLNEDKTKYITLEEYPDNYLLDDLDGVGGGFLLVKTDVFKNIPAPWFCFEPLGEKVIGEDYGFCRRAREAGYKIHLDTSVKLGHVGTYIYSEADFKQVKSQEVAVGTGNIQVESPVEPIRQEVGA